MTKILLLSFFITPCSSFILFGSLSSPDSCKQGIDGYVISVSGNQMPSPGVKRRSARGVKVTVYVYELTHISQTVRQGQSPYYSAIHTKMVRQADTDDTGYFKIILPPGHYSLFTKKKDLFYASRFDTRNNIAPVEVSTGKMTRVECRIEGDRPVSY